MAQRRGAGSGGAGAERREWWGGCVGRRFEGDGFGEVVWRGVGAKAAVSGNEGIGIVERNHWNC